MDLPSFGILMAIVAMQPLRISSNFVKLAYMAPSIHHSGGTVCEPVDVPVNKRHLDMIYAHMRYSDKPFMGSVTAPERAEDTIAMCKILFGDDFVDQNTVLTSLINANSPMVFDETMLGALKVYARNNQACIVTPFILAGAMSPVTVAGTLTQVLAEVLAGAALTQLIRPGAPVLFGTFASSISMQSGAPTFGTPEPSLVSYGAAQLARRLGLPFRTGGSLCASKVPDAQAAYESANTLNSTILAGTNFVLHSAGWLEGGLASCYEKFMMDIDQLGMQQKFCEGVDLSAKTARLWTPFAKSVPAATISAARTHKPISRPRFTVRRSRTTTPLSSGSLRAKRQRRSAPMNSRAAGWTAMKRLNLIRQLTRRFRRLSGRRRSLCPTPSRERSPFQAGLKWLTSYTRKSGAAPSSARRSESALC
jgi:hypothetical protein